jgi:hypothetical protein
MSSSCKKNHGNDPTPPPPPPPPPPAFDINSIEDTYAGIAPFAT